MLQGTFLFLVLFLRSRDHVLGEVVCEVMKRVAIVEVEE